MTVVSSTPEPSPGGPPVWIVNADHWPRAYLRAELMERGYDAIGFETLRDALARLALRPERPPALLLIDLAGQIVDDRQRAALASARVPILAVVPAGAGAADARPGDAPPPDIVGTLHRPLTIGAIADAVDRLLRRS